MITDKMLEENTTAWGLLSTEMQNAFLACTAVSYYGLDGNWSKSNLSPHSLTTDKTIVLRKYVAPLTKPDIPWDMIQEEYKYAVKNHYGNIWIYDFLPLVYNPALETKGYWYPSQRNADKKCISDFLKIDPGTCDWKDSLVERPTKDK